MRAPETLRGQGLTAEDIEELGKALSEAAPEFRGDAVLMRGVIHHLESPERAFREIHRVLPEGGRLVVLEGNVGSTYRRMALGFADLIGKEHEASQFPHTPFEDIQRILEAVGFTDVRVSQVSGPFAPLAYLGIGGPRSWAVLNAIGRAAGKVAPRFFGWWYLLVATRTTPGDTA